jgi:hypothetical protein
MLSWWRLDVGGVASLKSNIIVNDNVKSRMP